LRIKIVFLFSLIFLLAACSDKNLTFLEGDKKNISEFKGSWLLINYWAGWCKPCLEEIPELNVFNSRSDVQVLAFNYDQLDGEALKEQIGKFGIEYRSLNTDPAPLFQLGKPTGLPATIVINPKGQYVEWLYGAQNKVSLEEVLSK